MSTFHEQRLDLVAPCEWGVEGVLADELVVLGALDVRPGPRVVTFSGDLETLWRVNLGSRLANRVMVVLARGPVDGRDALYELAMRVPWERHFDVNQTIAVDSRTAHSGLVREEFVNQVVKDAVCDRFRRLVGTRPSVDRKNPAIPIAAYVTQSSATLLLDASGERLSRRGYRARAGAAPLRETLAAGMIALSAWNPNRPFLDPMCGSGTLAIEAALMARRVAPGLLRLRRGGAGFAFERWLGHDATAFARLVARAREQVLEWAPAPIVAGDRDGAILDVAVDNAELAFVRQDIEFVHGDVRDMAPQRPETVVVTNPPYGERLGTVEDASAIYGAIGDALKRRFPGSSASVLCGHPALVGAVGLKPTRKNTLWNGAIECTLARFDVYEGTRRHRHGSGEVE